MKKLGTILLYGSALVFAGALIYVSVSPNKKTESSDFNTQERTQKTEAQEIKSADKVQVFVFHSNNRCYSCVTMGKYAKATIEEFFQPELRDGKVEFREINVDLPENKEVARKFQATGSSLFLNAVVDDKDNIEQDTQVWRLLEDKQAFSEYLSEKINSLL